MRTVEGENIYKYKYKYEYKYKYKYKYNYNYRYTVQLTTNIFIYTSVIIFTFASTTLQNFIFSSNKFSYL